jgi:hypothetical protein
LLEKSAMEPLLAGYRPRVKGSLAAVFGRAGQEVFSETVETFNVSGQEPYPRFEHAPERSGGAALGTRTSPSGFDGWYPGHHLDSCDPL